MKKIALFALIIAGTSPLFAQLPLSIGYSGSNFTRPGLHISLEKDAKTLNAKKPKITSKKISQGIQLGFYIHPQMQKAIYLAPQIGFVKSNMNNWMYKYEMGTGFLASFVSNSYFYNGKSYEKRTAKSQFDFIITPSFSFGKVVNNSFFDAWHIKNRILWMPFYNLHGTFRYFFELGISKNI